MLGIYDDEQRSYWGEARRGQARAAQRVAAARAVRQRRGSLPMSRIACVASSRRTALGARNAARGTFTTGC